MYCTLGFLALKHNLDLPKFRQFVVANYKHTIQEIDGGDGRAYLVSELYSGTLVRMFQGK